MDPILIGGLLFVLIFGIAGFFLFSSGTGTSLGLAKTLGIGGGTGGILGVIFGMWSAGWQFLYGCVTGQIGFLGYAFVFFLALTLAVWGWNGFRDLSRDRPLGFVD